MPRAPREARGRASVSRTSPSRRPSSRASALYWAAAAFRCLTSVTRGRPQPTTASMKRTPFDPPRGPRRVGHEPRRNIAHTIAAWRILEAPGAVHRQGRQSALLPRRRHRVGTIEPRSRGFAPLEAQPSDLRLHTLPVPARPADVSQSRSVRTKNLHGCSPAAPFRPGQGSLPRLGGRSRLVDSSSPVTTKRGPAAAPFPGTPRPPPARPPRAAMRAPSWWNLWWGRRQRRRHPGRLLRALRRRPPDQAPC